MITAFSDPTSRAWRFAITHEQIRHVTTTPRYPDDGRSPDRQHAGRSGRPSVPAIPPRRGPPESFAPITYVTPAQMSQPRGADHPGHETQGAFANGADGLRDGHQRDPRRPCPLAADVSFDILIDVGVRFAPTIRSVQGLVVPMASATPYHTREGNPRPA